MKNAGKKRQITYLIVLLIYFLFTIFIAFHHEAWRDESQAWVLARNSSFAEILTLCSSEGHPFLWFFLLKIFSSIGLSFFSFSLISIFIMTVSAFFVLWKSPFSMVSKICILLSPVFFYYNAVICRNYSITVLLVVLLCVLWQKRDQHPIKYGIVVAFLFQSHIMIAGLAIGCLFEMILNIKKKETKYLIGTAIPLISFICMIIELRQTENTETFTHISLEGIQSRLGEKMLSQFSSSVTNWFNIPKGFPAGEICLWIMILSFTLFIIFCCCDRSFRVEARWTGIVSVSGAAVFWGIIILIRTASHIQMAIVFWMVVLFFVWTVSYIYHEAKMQGDKEKKTGIINQSQINISTKRKISVNIFEAAFMICCILAMPKCLWEDPVKDIKAPYSGSLEIVKKIEQAVPDRSTIVIHNNELNTSVAAYLYDIDKDLMIWDIDNGCEYCIHKWGRQNLRSVSDDMLNQYITSDLGKDGYIYYVRSSYNFDNEILSINSMELIDRNSEENVWDEYYQLYKLSE